MSVDYFVRHITTNDSDLVATQHYTSSQTLWFYPGHPPVLAIIYMLTPGPSNYILTPFTNPSHRYLTRNMWFYLPPPIYLLNLLRPYKCFYLPFTPAFLLPQLTSNICGIIFPQGSWKRRFWFVLSMTIW